MVELRQTFLSMPSEQIMANECLLQLPCITKRFAGVCCFEQPRMVVDKVKCGQLINLVDTYLIHSKYYGHKEKCGQLI